MQTSNILKKVKNAYNSIAQEFSDKRYRAWPEFEIFLKKLKKHFGSQPIHLLDIGCGNGRVANFLKDEPVHYMGLDNSRALLKIAKQKSPQAKFKLGDILKLPFPAQKFDVVWSIAVLHHLPTEKLQLQSLQEVRRVLKKDGMFMLTVWDLWQPKYQSLIDPKTHDAWIPWGNQQHKSGDFRSTSSGLVGPERVLAKEGGRVSRLRDRARGGNYVSPRKIKRFYHAFKVQEMKNLLKKAGFSGIQKVSLPGETDLRRNFIFICQAEPSRRG
ncbi:MAG: class I SAM-dependent methyltransferase [Patescibacteria group bacterium]